MLLSEHWLRTWVDAPQNPQALAEALTMGGFEVEGIDSLHPDFTKVVIGRIVVIDSHPRRAKLKVCTVDAGRARPLQIVCGASNVRVGMKVPVALPGARITGGRDIHKTRIGEVVSAGMLCAATELGLTESGQGQGQGEARGDSILQLDDDAVIGTDVGEHLHLYDRVFDIALTPNRGDCLSVRGMAREVAALTAKPLHAFVIPTQRASIKATLTVRLLHKVGCPRYVGRIIRGINATAHTPDWMRERLRRAGLRSLGVVVDITNYVMLELGQPMHAFDATQIKGGIVVRKAVRGETLKLLDQRKLKLTEGMMLIADHEKPLALAGIMGGDASSVQPNTTDIFLEAAYFDASTVTACAQRCNVQSDASFRFERGVDAHLQELAMQRATKLVLQLCGGQAGRVVNQVSPRHIPVQKTITLRRSRLRHVLGQNIASARVQSILLRLNMKPRRGKGGDGWSVKPPGYRYDLKLECDLIEEIARVNGYEHVPVAPLLLRGEPPAIFRHRLSLSDLRACIVARDYQEVLTYSFVDPELQNFFEAPHKAVRLVNPLAANMCDLRTSQWPGLLAALSWNYSRQHRRIRLFECGVVFEPSRRHTNGVHEQTRLSAVITGEASERQWSAHARGVDLFDMKGDVEALLLLGGAPQQFTFQPATHRGLHDGQCARIFHAGKACGWLGRLAPQVEQYLDVGQAVYVFEMALDALLQRHSSYYRAPSAYPSVRRDLSVHVVEATPVQSVFKSIRKSAGALLHDLQLFDIYRGEQVDHKIKSVLFGLTFQSASRTLRDEEIEHIMNRINTTLASEFPLPSQRPATTRTLTQPLAQPLPSREGDTEEG